MTAPNPREQKAAKQVLRVLFREPSTVSAIHYSCESFYNRPRISSPRVTSIAICNLASQQTDSFSIHRVAERRGIDFEDIKDAYDCLEEQMLSEFFDHLSHNPNTKWLHWNMRDENFGFQAIAHRLRVLTGDDKQPTVIPESQKFDMARILKSIYGPAYVGDPRMQKLLEKNEMVPQDFLAGNKEALAFEQQRYDALYLSTLSKAKAITEVAQLAFNNALKTNTSKWQLHGGKIRTNISWFLEHPTVATTMTLLGTLMTLAGIAIAVRF